MARQVASQGAAHPALRRSLPLPSLRADARTAPGGLGTRVPDLSRRRGATRRRHGHHLGDHCAPGWSGLRCLRAAADAAHRPAAHGGGDARLRAGVDLQRPAGVPPAHRGRGSDGPAQLPRAIAEIFPPTERGKAIGWVFSATGVGAAFGVPLVAFLLDAGGWRFPFAVLGPAVAGSSGALGWALAPSGASSSPARPWRSSPTIGRSAPT